MLNTIRCWCISTCCIVAWRLRRLVWNSLFQVNVVTLRSFQSVELELKGLIDVLHFDLAVEMNACNCFGQSQKTFKLADCNATGTAHVSAVLSEFFVTTHELLMRFWCDFRLECTSQTNVSLQVELRNLRGS